MSDNKSSTEEVVDTGKKMLKKTIAKSMSFIMKIVLIIVLPLILLVSSLYVVFNDATSDQDLEKFEKWLENDETIEYE